MSTLPDSAENNTATDCLSHIHHPYSLYYHLCKEGFLGELPPQVFVQPLPSRLVPPLFSGKKKICTLLILMIANRTNIKLIREAFSAMKRGNVEIPRNQVLDILEIVMKSKTLYSSYIFDKAVCYFHKDQPECLTVFRAVDGGLMKGVSEMGPGWENWEPQLLITPLEYACYRGRVNAINRLLETGVDPEKYTLFHPVVLVSSEPLAVLSLARAGADINAGGFFSTQRGVFCITPLQHAAARGSLVSIHRLVEEGAALEEALLASVMHDKKDAFELLEQLGAKMSRRDFAILLTKKEKTGGYDWFFSEKLDSVDAPRLISSLNPKIWRSCNPELMPYVEKYSGPSAKRAAGTLAPFLLDVYFQPGGPGSVRARDNFHKLSQGRK